MNGTSPRQPIQRGRKVLAATSLLLVGTLGFGYGSGRIAETSASWTDQSHTFATFTAGDLKAIPTLQCFDTRSAPENTTINPNQVLLRWTAPDGFPDAPLDYEISWDGGLLGLGGTAPLQSGTEYKYTYTGSNLLSLNIRFTVRPILHSWTGPVAEINARGITLLFVSSLDC